VTRRQLLSLLSGLAATVAISACGKKGRPKPPDPEKSTFPKQYPKPQ
jgi:predicted small lipoprotein YifL